MARIAGIDLPPQKRLWVGLTAIYGIGQERARKLANQAGVDFNKKSAISAKTKPTVCARRLKKKAASKAISAKRSR